MDDDLLDAPPLEMPEPEPGEEEEERSDASGSDAGEEAAEGLELGPDRAVVPDDLRETSDALASFEMAARRAGVRGFFATIAWLPWKDPVFAGPALAV